MKTRNKLKSLRKKAWKEESEAIRKEEGRCYTCGVVKNWKELQLGHFRHGNNMDFERKNVHAQCRRCNLFLSGNLGVYAEKLEAQYGHGIIQELNKKADQIKIFKQKDYEAIIKLYEGLGSKIKNKEM